MSEGKPKVENVVDFIERRRLKDNSGKREKLGQTPDGYALFPEEKIDITAHNALELANDILKALDLNTEEERFRKGQLNFGIDRTDLADQREWVRSFSTQRLLRILDGHAKSPTRYSKALLLAVAEEFVRKCSSPA